MTKIQAVISVKTSFIPQQSDKDKNYFVFSYTITIKNISDSPFQLISRFWLIQDANQKIEEVFGEGVIGQQPIIRPGESFTYTSGAVLETEIGTMEGKYFMRSLSQADRQTDNQEFEVPIEKFVLSVPRILH